MTLTAVNGFCQKWRSWWTSSALPADVTGLSLSRLTKQWHPSRSHLPIKEQQPIPSRALSSISSIPSDLQRSRLMSDTLAHRCHESARSDADRQESHTTGPLHIMNNMKPAHTVVFLSSPPEIFWIMTVFFSLMCLQQVTRVHRCQLNPTGPAVSALSVMHQNWSRGVLLCVCEWKRFFKRLCGHTLSPVWFQMNEAEAPWAWCCMWCFSSEKNPGL